MKYLIISTSLNPKSRSRVLAREALAVLQETDPSAEWMDLIDHPLPLCDGDSTYEDARAKAVREIIHRADGILLAVPIYNFAVSAAAKNLLEIAGRAWSNKVVGFLCAAGGKASYMSVMGLANSLMLDFRCIIIPRFVYATGEAFVEENLSDPDVRKRVREVAGELGRVSTALKK